MINDINSNKMEQVWQCKLKYRTLAPYYCKVRYDYMKKNDIYLIGGIILIVAVSFLLMQIFRREGSKVLITIDGIEHKTFSLNDDISYEILHDGNRNVIEIKDGYVSMTSASCPDKLCVKHNRIRYNIESITCLPNGVDIRIIGGEESGLDAIAQ